MAKPTPILTPTTFLNSSEFKIAGNRPDITNVTVSAHIDTMQVAELENGKKEVLISFVMTVDLTDADSGDVAASASAESQSRTKYSEDGDLSSVSDATLAAFSTCKAAICYLFAMSPVGMIQIPNLPTDDILATFMENRKPITGKELKDH